MERLPIEQRLLGGPRGIATIALLGIVAHLLLRYGSFAPDFDPVWPLRLALGLGGGALVVSLLRNLIAGRFGADFLAGLSIGTSLWLGEELAGTIVVLMMAGGETLEEFAVGRASAVVDALVRRMPSVAHREEAGVLVDLAVESIRPGDHIVVLPHEICPVDGVVVEGHGRMDESFLTGEPWEVPKAPGSEVTGGAANRDNRLVIEARRPAKDSRYAKIVAVVGAARDGRPRMRRMGDKLGAAATPIALGVAVLAWLLSGDPTRFLAVLVVATPCPLLIAIPVTIIGAVSTAARHGILLRDPVVLERLPECRTLILDKTGTLTVGQPQLTAIVELGSDTSQSTSAAATAPAEASPSALAALALAASAEQYSRHPLAAAVLAAAHERGLALEVASEVAERPGEGLRSIVGGRVVVVAGRSSVAEADRALLPASEAGLECLVLVDNRPTLLLRFHDAPRPESRAFVTHLGPHHNIDRILLVSGDREEEVRWLAEAVGITDVRADQEPEDKLRIVREESQRAPVAMVGDGINDAPALLAAHVGIALGRAHEVTAEAAGAFVLEPNLAKVDVLFHLAQRQRRIALQSAFGGMALSAIGMGFAAFGLLPPVAGAIAQEVIDLAAVLNAVRTAFPGGTMTDMER